MEDWFQVSQDLSYLSHVRLVDVLFLDTWRPEERGMAIALYSLAPLLGPCVGPIAGAWIGQRSTWRWVFWASTIADAIVQIMGLFFLKESEYHSDLFPDCIDLWLSAYAPVLLERKAARIRKEMEQDSEKGYQPKVIRTVFESSDRQYVISLFLYWLKLTSIQLETNSD